MPVKMPSRTPVSALFLLFFGGRLTSTYTNLVSVHDNKFFSTPSLEAFETLVGDVDFL